MSDAEHRDDLLTTNQLLARIEEELGYVFDRETIVSWARRQSDPLPLAYRGRPGQSHKYDWLTFLSWFEAECERQDRVRGSADINTLDYHDARTIEMRERAKRSIIETNRQAGELGEVARMEAAAEDLARQAVTKLLAIPARLAPLLAAESDETRCDTLLQNELRAICNEIAAAKPFADPAPDAPADSA